MTIQTIPYNGLLEKSCYYCILSDLCSTVRDFSYTNKSIVFLAIQITAHPLCGDEAPKTYNKHTLKELSFSECLYASFTCFYLFPRLIYIFQPGDL